MNYTRIGSNDMAKFIYYQILANTLILKLKQNENISVLFSYWYSLNGSGVINMCLANVCQFEPDPSVYKTIQLSAIYVSIYLSLITSQ